ncbi:hypothetical protein MC885_007003 [Smutsia gigantea]|nr:hypothetical protein MC885_007003 [Smutsia gigantea]
MAEWQWQALDLTCPSSAPAPTRPRPPADSAQVPRWLHGAILTLYVLVALCCITVAASVLVKHSALSQELLDLKRELGNISASVGQCQEEQLQNRNAIQLSFQEAKTLMHIVKNNIQDCYIRQIKVKLQDISKKQETKPEPGKLAQGDVDEEGALGWAPASLHKWVCLTSGLHPTYSPKLNK